MKILVTGGGGFVGSNLIKALLQDENITHIYNIDPQVDGFNENNLIEGERVINISNDYMTLDECEWANIIKYKCDSKIDLIYTLGALSPVDYSLKNPKDFIYWNNETFISFLETIRRNMPAVPIIHMSTDEVFGSVDFDSFKENYYIYNPSSIYSSSKVQQEMIINVYKKAYNLNIKIVRATNMFGL